MKKTLLAVAAALAATALPSVSYAEDSPLSFNVGVVTDYRYRGISQSRLKPALQGGVDFAAPGGFYVGAWGSTIKWVKDFGGDSDVEIDLYGGWKGEVAKDLTLDVGVLTYQYPSNKLNPSANTTELYGALTYGPATLKYSQAVTNTFGNLDSKNSYYLDLSAGFDVGSGVTVTPHVGYQKIKGPFSDAATYTDYSLTASKDFSGFVVSAALVGTDADKDFYIPGPSANSTKFLGKTTVVLGVKKTF
jgi:uncharacterized protein (TIGR02001 family)